MIRKQDALDFHSQGRKGKIEVVPTKACSTQRDLSLAYTPGVAEPCMEIHRNPDDVYSYTAKGNLVAVITNGTAVLGLGNIGPLAAKPVMEGKAVLFKRFADIDVFDIELNAKDPDDIIRTVKALEPTFGGVNLEDIRAPECFYIEEKLRAECQIPIFHDDQHGTAIISAAAFLNALELVGKKIETVRVVFNGAGAAGIACANLYLSLGVKRENIVMCDSHGVIYEGRGEGMNPYKQKYAQATHLRTLAAALQGADAFVGVSVKDAVTPEMIRSMADHPIVFAMANPDPEISYEDAVASRPDVIMATGRSDTPNQVNNVLGFPFIFRGALDVRARGINEEMKIAAVQALRDLAKEDVPDSVCRAYGDEQLKFGPTYIIPKPLDPRVLLRVAPAVARAAMESGAARIQIDLDKYRDEIEARLGKSREIMRLVIHKARRNPKRIVFPEGEADKILHACQILLDDHIAQPILLGRAEVIEARCKELNLDLTGVEITHPTRSNKLEAYADKMYSLRQRRGVTRRDAQALMRDRNYFGPMMVEMGDADGLIAGLTQHYPDTIRPALQIIKVREGLSKVSGLYMMVFKQEVYFFADTTVNIEPSSEDLAEIAICAADTARRFDVEPKVAMLSFSNFGSVKHAQAERVARAVALVRQRDPKLLVEGEMQADTAVVADILARSYPFSQLQERANVLIFPDLQSGNIAYKLLARLGGATAIGPILMGLSKPVHVLQRGAEVADIVNMCAIAVVDAQETELPLWRR